MPKGSIVKALSGYYYVQPDEKETAGTIQCRARGIFKKNKITPLVGDRVMFSLTENGEGMVDEILPRRSELIRPPVANVELAVLVFSVTRPVLNLQLLDKFLVHIESAGLETIIVLTKADLLEDGEDPGENELKPYREMGYDIYLTSVRAGIGVEEVRSRLIGTTSVFSGQSGVGKSSLLNAIVPGLTLETNEISNKLGRGKHTTRHVELIPLDEGGRVADTPGFSQLDFMELEAEDLGNCFREIRELSEHCRFRGCLHLHEPNCAVQEAVEDGKVARSRYDNYLQFLSEIRERKRRY
ncbi:ribosome small subunit-dependent GTPase A [Gorillibacterium massiliense]|uniref:ribosome small subunit-dependent GTPase A n=1 Tax=Gorillibacterium massiliense TaxID=1280390 RepID=UPI0004B76A7A|nr:ribosome small subunit-dependent GTPase A [Gorillibacterium massiliense]